MNSSHYQDNDCTIYHGDCVEVMKTMPENSIDTIITDPPYELGFMGKSWDKSGVPFQISTWKEALRVAKPGALLLAFGGTRTHHRLMCALEDAGWEIRDTMMWLYGSGFPKSHDISKAIDKAGIWNDEFDEVRAWLRKKVKEKKLTHQEIDTALGNVNSHLASHYLGQSQPMLPNWDQWLIIKELLGVDEDIDRPPKCIGYERAILGYRKVNRGVAFTSDGPDELPITAPATPEAQLWNGYGTALKPAWEPIIVAMKPLDGTFANNALKWGVGGLNIDGGRINYQSEYDKSQATPQGKPTGQVFDSMMGRKREEFARPEQKGRWPANVILSHHPECERVGVKKVKGSHTGTYKRTQTEEVQNRTSYVSPKRPQGVRVDRNNPDGTETVEDWKCHPDCPVRLLDEQSGVLSSHGGGTSSTGFWQRDNRRQKINRGDSGGASRFFYCAKASPSERGKNNKHPTVKPLKLIEYLCKLTMTPAGGVVLDCFGGSGTTALACRNTGRKCILIEKDECETAITRLGMQQQQNYLKQCYA